VWISKEIRARSAWRPWPLLRSIDVPRGTHHRADVGFVPLL